MKKIYLMKNIFYKLTFGFLKRKFENLRFLKEKGLEIPQNLRILRQKKVFPSERNRYGIEPGIFWDGKDRSNEFERDFVAKN